MIAIVCMESSTLVGIYENWEKVHEDFPGISEDDDFPKNDLSWFECHLNKKTTLMCGCRYH